MHICMVLELPNPRIESQNSGIFWDSFWDSSGVYFDDF